MNLKKLILRNIDCTVNLPYKNRKLYGYARALQNSYRTFLALEEWKLADRCYEMICKILNQVPDNSTVDAEDESDVHNQYYWWFSRVPDKMIEEYIKSKAEKA